ncbi:NAD(P)-binding protein [Rhodoblastus acidophilus]|uniref:NAD(P)-binding protein n=1 Tax=Candidatus Rhodoblastus alkanivorans TaxID=2954117 RepID=A0ABS9Z8L1_9HYPH|nr:NAD(P)-binding protein [Candidatus Rhodoblastus alkanivorans]MCI4680333.1 NAD(P)-binding protein [Candidatus Rhodoblastus alkanivorans]MCI4684014.1 NAD(P)-binding protein [Candidatus Rhodoblastus alkanivorans]MDI4641333.1 NAD(P)-binding protein [Rhodoblastus acidophilus]
MNETAQKKDLTFRRFKTGETMWDWPDLTEKIFQQDKSYKCPTYVHRAPPCQGSCPSGHDIRGWLSIARGMDKPPVAGQAWQEYAFNRMVEANPFPATMGRVCPAPCEDGCNRNEVDDFVGINGVEQYVGDWAIEQKLALPTPSALSGKKIAVIGGGPAGLSAAWFLRGKGHAVTIFEAHELLGGMMRFGIPGYRTPREMLDAEIERITSLDGVEVRTNTRVGVDVSMDELERDYDAIFWGIGAQKGRPLPVPGADAVNCITGVEFLDAFNNGWVLSTAKNIVVVGGGDTSIDVASVARRIGHITARHEHDVATAATHGYTAHDVTGALAREGVKAVLTSLFPIEQMTAAEREREDAKREGVEIKGGVMPLEVIKGMDGSATGLRMCQCTVKGNAPTPVEGTEFVIECDMIISAIGQMADLAEGLEKLDGGRSAIAIDGLYKVKGLGKHFAGGDAVRPHLLTTAIGHGRVAAETIDHFLGGALEDKRPKVDVHQFNLLEELHHRHLDPTAYDHKQVRGTSDGKFAIHNYEDRGASQIIPHKALFKGHFTFVARNKRDERHVEADQVMGDFAERIVAFSEAQAQAEGQRCMSCGMCFECDNCVIFCPQTAVSRVPKKDRAVGRYVQTDYKKCIGCHICADVCPTGYIQMGLGE